MFKILSTLTLSTFLLVKVASAVTLTWDAPTTNDDGSPITGLYSYKVYYRAKTIDPFTSLGEVLAPTVTFTLSLAKGEYLVRAVNDLGLESVDSNILIVRSPGKVIITGIKK
jgi:hypothetical protein